MERGTYRVSEDPAEIYERLAPLATSRLRWERVSVGNVTGVLGVD